MTQTKKSPEFSTRFNGGPETLHPCFRIGLSAPACSGRFKVHPQWTLLFLAPPTMSGIMDSYGIERIHPIREGRSAAPVGRKGISNHCWIVGRKRCLLIHSWGGAVGWLSAPANVHDTVFHPLIEVFGDRMLALADSGFHARIGDPPYPKLCLTGTWNDRMLIEAVFSMLTLISHTKKMMHHMTDYVLVRLAFTVTAFNLPIQWQGLQPDKQGFMPLSIVEFNLCIKPAPLVINLTGGAGLIGQHIDVTRYYFTSTNNHRTITA